MFEMFFPKRPKDRPTLPEPTPTLALGALLVRVAMADQEYDVSEIAVIDRILASSFGLGPIDAAKLRATCEALERDAPGTDEFATLLRDNVSYTDRRAFVAAMWEVLLADGDHDPNEETELHAIELALGITPEDSATVKNAALGARTES